VRRARPSAFELSTSTHTQHTHTHTPAHAFHTHTHTHTRTHTYTRMRHRTHTHARTRTHPHAKFREKKEQVDEKEGTCTHSGSTFSQACTQSITQPCQTSRKRLGQAYSIDAVLDGRWSKKSGLELFMQWTDKTRSWVPFDDQDKGFVKGKAFDFFLKRVKLLSVDAVIQAVKGGTLVGGPAPRRLPRRVVSGLTTASPSTEHAGGLASRTEWFWSLASRSARKPLEMRKPRQQWQAKLQNQYECLLTAFHNATETDEPTRCDIKRCCVSLGTAPAQAIDWNGAASIGALRKCLEETRNPFKLGEPVADGPIQNFTHIKGIETGVFIGIGNMKDGSKHAFAVNCDDRVIYDGRCGAIHLDQPPATLRKACDLTQVQKFYQVFHR
jgi:hypothetical protein